MSKTGALISTISSRCVMSAARSSTASALATQSRLPRSVKAFGSEGFGLGGHAGGMRAICSVERRDHAMAIPDFAFSEIEVHGADLVEGLLIAIGKDFLGKADPASLVQPVHAILSHSARTFRRR